MTAWTTSAAIRAEIERHWQRGALPATIVARAIGLLESPLEFPLRMALRRPGRSDLGSRFEAVRAWVRDLEAGAVTGRFDLVWEDVNTRALGHNRLPVAAVLPSVDAATRLIGRSETARWLADAAATTVSRFPALAPWLVRRAVWVLEHEALWPEVLAALAWFRAHPRSGVYLRQVDVPGLHTKFFDTRRALFAELLDLVMPSDAIDHAAVGAAQFERRFGLVPKPPLIRFRTLDAHLAVNGLTDVTIPIADFARLNLPAERAFVIENEITFLAFPAYPGAIAIFGAGYGVERLGEAAWLARAACTYWGDIDTHGFAILDGLRARLPFVRSMLMSREVLDEFRPFWTREETPHVADLPRLTEAERSVYDDLRYDRLGIGIRLEQERIPMSYANPS